MGRIINKVDNRILTAIGFIVLAFSCLLLADVNFDIGMNNVIWPNIMSGVGMGLIFIPLGTITFGTLKDEFIGAATGLFNLMRNIGGSIGISITATLLANRAQMHQSLMISHLNPYNPVYQNKIHEVTQFFALKSGYIAASYQAKSALYNSLRQQASLWGFVDNFRLFALLCLVMIPLIFCFKKVNLKRKLSAH